MNHRQLDEAGLIGRVIDSLRGLLVVLRLRGENILHKFLRITIIQWKPRGLNLNHETMPRQKYVIGIGQIKTIG